MIEGSEKFPGGYKPDSRKTSSFFSKTHPEHRKEEDKALQEGMLGTNKSPITLWRERHGLTRVELAALVGIATSSVEKLELGYYKNISQKLLIALHDKAAIPYELIALYPRWRASLGEKARQKLKDQG